MLPMQVTRRPVGDGSDPPVDMLIQPFRHSIRSAFCKSGDERGKSMAGPGPRRKRTPETPFRGPGSNTRRLAYGSAGTGADASAGSPFAGRRTRLRIRR